MLASLYLISLYLLTARAENRMPVFSKTSYVDGPCSELVHPWQPSCVLASREFMGTCLVGSFKVYAVFYAVSSSSRATQQFNDARSNHTPLTLCHLSPPYLLFLLLCPYSSLSNLPLVFISSFLFLSIPLPLPLAIPSSPPSLPIPSPHPLFFSLFSAHCSYKGQGSKAFHCE